MISAGFYVMRHLSFQNNKPVKIVNRDGTEVLFEYDGQNNLTKAVDELGNTVSYTYDSMDNLIGVDTLLPSKKDVKQLYEYLNNGKYHQ